MKQTFEIPEGCTRVTIEQHKDKLVTIFELKESKSCFEDGDIIYCEDCHCKHIFIFKTLGTEINPFGYHVSFLINNETNKYPDTLKFNDFSRDDMDIIRFATESEKQLLFDALSKVGKKWNAEKNCIEELKPERWRANKGDYYWAIDSCFDAFQIKDDYSKLDNARFEFGSYFKTEQQASDFAELIKQLPR